MRYGSSYYHERIANLSFRALIYYIYISDKDIEFLDFGED